MTLWSCYCSIAQAIRIKCIAFYSFTVPYVIGIDVGGTKVAIGLFDGNRQLRQEHRDLIVRVAGYSAFFNVLSRETQDDIIERTEQVL